MKKYVFVAVLLIVSGMAFGTKNDKVKTKVDFANTLQDWDGFGINYVEVAQTMDYEKDPQEYGGFSRLNEKQRQELLDMVFGDDGLKVNIIKMFFDPFHQKEPGGEFDHETTTKWMRYFAHQGIAKTRERGGQDIEIITTLYGPPAWSTKQKILRGRDMDPKYYNDVALYMIDWVRYLKETEKLPVKYLSLHNEGDSPDRWPRDGSHGNIGTGHDYNSFWLPQQVAYFLEFMGPMMKASGLDVGLTPGECTTWQHMSRHWYHWAIYKNPEAHKNLALITSHGFGVGKDINSEANDVLRMGRPELHSWTTSMSWGGRDNRKDYDFIYLMKRNIYDAKVNAIIPWSAFQTDTWVGGDPNPACAFFIHEDGRYEVRPGYYFYKQLAPIGQRGMKVASVSTEANEKVELIGFASNGTKYPDAFLVMNISDQEMELEIDVKGTTATSFEASRSTMEEKNMSLGNFKLTNGKLIYKAPAGSVSTFVAK